MAPPDPQEPARARGRPYANLRRCYPTACAHCGSEFPGLSWQRYCSAACRKRACKIQAPQRGYKPPTRPAGRRVDRLPAVRPCVNCRRVLSIAARGRCMPCAQYLRRHGADRPAEGFWHVARPCSNCGRPTRSRNGPRCRACAVYRWRWEVERPPSLWRDHAPHLRDALGRFLPHAGARGTVAPV